MALNMVVINEGGVPDAEVQAFVAAAGEYIGKWLIPFWPGEATGTTISLGAAGLIPHRSGQIVLAPTTTLANSMGYHEVSPDGYPISIVELDACRRYGVPWTEAATHEIAEMLVNPKLDRFVANGGRNWPVEIADPTTSDHFTIGGVTVSNVSTPEWWGLSNRWPRYDIMGRVKAPLPTIPHGGWLEWEEGGVYRNAWGADLPPRRIAYLAERQGRRWRIRHSPTPR